MTSTICDAEPPPQHRSGGAPREIAPAQAARHTGTRPVSEPGLSGKSILLLHDDPFLGSYIRAVLAGADAMVLGPASPDEGRNLLLAGAGIDAAVLDFGLSCAGSHALADELARRALPYLFVRGRSPCSASALLRGRPCLGWPFAGYEVCETLAGMLNAAPA